MSLLHGLICYQWPSEILKQLPVRIPPPVLNTGTHNRTPAKRRGRIRGTSKPPTRGSSLSLPFADHRCSSTLLPSHGLADEEDREEGNEGQPHEGLGHEGNEGRSCKTAI